MALVRRSFNRSGLSCGVVAAAFVGAAFFASPSGAVVVQDWDAVTPPADGFVGRWNGSSGVAVGEYWFVTARHVGGSVGANFLLKGQNYRSVEIVQHDMADLQLVRVDRELPGWHRIASNVGVGDPVMVGGFGATAGNYIGGGYDWTGQRRETWGYNTVVSIGARIAIRFDEPGSPDFVPSQAIFAVNDSGGGLFTIGADGSLELAGVAVSVSGVFGQSRYGNWAYTITMEHYRNWVNSHANLAAPMSSSIAAPVPLLGINDGERRGGVAADLGLAANAAVFS